MPSKDERYQQILQQLTRQQNQKATEPAQQKLVGVLNELNVWQALEQTREKAPQGVYAFGPRSVRHGSQKAQVYGTAIWFKPGGFYGYKSLALLGVWAQEISGSDVEIVLGHKPLVYTAPIYNPESYHKIIRKDYRPYYADDNLPPSGDNTVRLLYDKAERLMLRQQIANTLFAAINLK